MIDEALLEKLKNNPNLMYSETFFNELKSESLIDFRNKVNSVENIDVSLYFENKIREYYDFLLSQYNSKTKLFNTYNDIIYCLKTGDYRNFNPNENDIFILNNEVLNEINMNDIEKTYNNLLEITNRKISEIIIDSLFQDTYYNVIINIKEMIRYNSLLKENEKVLNLDKIEFYKNILNFDIISCEDKIKLYNELKNKNINLEFYDDLRNIKNICYTKIKESIINLDEKSDFIDKELSDKYNTIIYDFKDKEYVMLVRTRDEYKEKTDYRIDSYSLISNEKNNVYPGKFIYGYKTFDIDCISHIFESDSGVKKVRDKKSIGTSKVNRLLTVEQLIKGDSNYNEINIVNKKNDVGSFAVVKPDFLIVYDIIDEEVIKESKRLNIPIVIIREKKLDNKNNDVAYQHNIDDYTDNDFIELEERRREYR